MVIYKSKPSLPEKAHEKFITRFLEAAPFNQVELENSKRETKKRGRFLFVSFTTRKKVCAISYLVEMSADKQKPQNRHEIVTIELIMVPYSTFWSHLTSYKL